MASDVVARSSASGLIAQRVVRRLASRAGGLASRADALASAADALQVRREAEFIPELNAKSTERVTQMLETEERPVKPAPKNAYLEKLRRMNEGKRRSSLACVPARGSR